MPIEGRPAAPTPGRLSQSGTAGRTNGPDSPDWRLPPATCSAASSTSLRNGNGIAQGRTKKIIMNCWTHGDRMNRAGQMRRESSPWWTAHRSSRRASTTQTGLTFLLTSNDCRHTWITMPRSSFPRRPALPDIWIYSPEVIQRKSCETRKGVSHGHPT